mmetsp:Transcript_26010/g.4458  ORF Transcript_26010/g.4458 Transcript_26010/m.4458 type:complete len:85 (+) Transcript_26010:565-819(+)
MEEINNKEELLGWTPTEFSKLEVARVSIRPYDELWNLVMITKEKTDEWHSAYLRSLEISDIERESKKILGMAKKLIFQFKDGAP